MSTTNTMESSRFMSKGLVRKAMLLAALCCCAPVAFAAAEANPASAEAGYAVAKVFLTMIGATSVGVLYALMWIVVALVVLVGFPVLLLILRLLDRFTRLNIPRKKRLLWAGIPTAAVLLLIGFIYVDIAYLTPRRVAAEPAPVTAAEELLEDAETPAPDFADDTVALPDDTVLFAE